MKKVVLDTNVFVSAILNSQGKPAKILDLIREGKIQQYISLSILEEVRQVLLYPHIKKIHKFKPKRVEAELQKIIRYAKLTPENITIEAVKDDPTDNKFIECAVEAKANYLISGDKHLKSLKKFKGIKIVSPAEFLVII